MGDSLVIGKKTEIFGIQRTVCWKWVSQAHGNQKVEEKILDLHVEEGNGCAEYCFQVGHVTFVDVCQKFYCGN